MSKTLRGVLQELRNAGNPHDPVVAESAYICTENGHINNAISAIQALIPKDEEIKQDDTLDIRYEKNIANHTLAKVREVMR